MVRHTKDFKNGTWYLFALHSSIKVRIKAKVEQSRERSRTFPYTTV